MQDDTVHTAYALNTRWDLFAAIVDLDGTMVDTLGDFELAIGRMLDDLGLPPVDRAFIARTVGKGSGHLVEATLEHVLAASPSKSVPNSRQARRVDFSAAYESYQRHYAVVNGSASTVFEGVREGLTALQQQGIKLACLTNKPRGFALALLKIKGLDTYFSQVFGGDSFQNKKPHPEPVWKTCDALHAAPHQTLMVGDSVNDALAARAAGCPVLLVTYGYNHGEPVHGLDADGFIGSLEQIGCVASAERFKLP